MTTPSPDQWHTRVTGEAPKTADRAVSPADHQHSSPAHEGSHGGHRWMMVACCIPMLVVVGALVASGVAGTGAIIYAVVCLGMMWLMMRAMPGGH